MKFIISCVLYFAATAFCSVSDNFIGKVFIASWAQSEERYKNVLVSPFSLVAPLGTLALASHGQTHKEILHALDVKKTKQIAQSYNEAISELEEESNTKITTANRVYVAHDSKINPDFYENSKKDFGIEAVNVNFKNAEKTADLINKWVAKKTENVIKNLVSPDSISASTRVMLVNTIYFEAKWEMPFNKIKDREFFVNKHTKLTAPYMSAELNIPYMRSSVLNAEVLLIPYHQAKCSFMIVYPNANVDIYTMKTKLKDRSALADVTKDMKITYLKLLMPKFEFDNRINLKEVLQKLNIKEIFTKNANITKMISESDPSKLYVNDAYQKAFIKVNEEGTQAAAANVFQIATGISQNPREVLINRPFHFEIGCSKNSLFSGILFKPKIN